MFKVKQSSHYIAYIVTQRSFDRCLLKLMTNGAKSRKEERRFEKKTHFNRASRPPINTIDFRMQLFCKKCINKPLGFALIKY